MKDISYETQPQHPQKKSFKKTILLGIGIVFFLFISAIALEAMTPSSGANNFDPVTLEPKEPEGFLKRLGSFVFQKDIDLAGIEEDRINILLMGMGGIGHDGPYLTDTMIIASVKPSTGEVAMISIPRDLGVVIPDHGWYKINHASAFGEAERANWGGAFATEVVEETFNIDISYYARVDFAAFEEIIDEMGGVTVHIDRSFVDYEFPDGRDGYQVLTFTEGDETMDGERALQFARSRHGTNGEGSDFARAARQQKVLLAMKEKALSFETIANPVRINNIIGTLDSHITTNMEFADVIALLKVLREVNTDQMTMLVLDNSIDGFLVEGRTAAGSFILSPKEGNFDRINDTIEHIFTYEPAKVVDNTPEQTIPAYTPSHIEVQNGTWQVGLASRTKALLETQEFVVDTVGNTIDRPQEKSAIIKLTEDPLTDVLQGLENTLHIPIKQDMPEGVTPLSQTDIIIILGEDFNEI